MKSLSILGSTGSVGKQTLDVAKNNIWEFKVVGLTANNNIEILKKQILEFKPEAVAVMNKEKADELKQNIDVPVYSGMEGIIKIATLSEADTVVNSLVGSIGVKPTIKAIQDKKNIALANKETLVTAGCIVMGEIKKNNVVLMPIDSEHSAIFQCLNGEKKEDAERIIITASGGPFKNHTKEQLENATLQDALNHPTWKMGNKITIDSATLMNKGFEVIEAHWLYNFSYDKIEVVIHQQSIIHSMVEFKDSSVIAQMGFPDMGVPIQYALSYPKRFKINSRKLDLVELENLSFSKPNLELFPCLKYAYEAGAMGGTMPVVLNAANEAVVGAFLEKKIKFLDISQLIKKMMDGHKFIKNPSLNEILDIDEKIKKETRQVIENEN